MQIMDKSKQGIIVAGSLIADVHYEIDTYPEQGNLSTVRSTTGAIGGSGNLILDLAKLDPELQVQVSALVGNDANGQMLMQTLGRFPNIDTSAVVRSGNSSVTLVMNANDTKQRTFFFIPEASDLYDESCIQWDQLNGKIFHLEYLLLMKAVDSPDPVYGTHGAKILHDAQERGMITSIDIVSEQSDRARTVVQAALKYTDICSVNEFEAEGITGISMVKDGEIDAEKAYQALAALKAAGVKKWAVIHSPACCYGLDCETGETACVPSLLLPKGYIKGTTGAGDAFCSGILYGACRGKALHESMRFANACAACSLSEQNGTDGMRSWEEVLKLEQELAED